MGMRRIEFEDGGHDGEFIVEDERFSRVDCSPFAQLENPRAGIVDAVIRTSDGRYFRVTMVSGVGAAEGDGHRPSWYEAHFLGVIEANLLRESWAVQVPQPDAPDVIP